MKKYIVVKTNVLRKQKFYKIHKSADSWSIDKSQAHKFILRRTAEKIAKAKTSATADCWKDIIKYDVEAVES